MAYQKMGDEQHSGRKSADREGVEESSRIPQPGPSNTSQEGHEGVRVPVHEDFLFDVDIERRELAPVYWLGPIFQVTRGTWFYDDGKAIDESLASQLEQGYLKIKPFRYPPPHPKSLPASIRSGEEPRSLAKSGALGTERDRSGSGEATPRGSMDGLRPQAMNEVGEEMQKTYRLFGTYMNSVVTYQDSTIACTSGNAILSRNMSHKILLMLNTFRAFCR